MRHFPLPAFCAILCALLLSCADEKPAKETVVVSIPPLRTLVAGLLDSAVDVRTLVPSGASPEPMPAALSLPVAVTVPP